MIDRDRNFPSETDGAFDDLEKQVLENGSRPFSRPEERKEAA
jgi:hypothetical protein